MAIDTASVQVFTDAELLVLYRAALAGIATGQSYTINGRVLTRANLKDVRDMIEWLEEREDASDVSGGGIVLADLGERV